LPAAYDAALDAGVVALGLRLEPAARSVIDGHVRLLLAWTQAVNLTAIRDPSAVATAHVVDSLTAVAPLRERGAERLIDLGSGGGLPGIPLAAALPARETLLVEAVGKKATFLRTAVAAIELADRVEVAATRAEALAHDRAHRGRWPAVTARAVASLGELTELAFPLLTRGGSLIAWKRGVLTDELRGARRAIDALGGGRLEVRDVAVPGLDRHVLAIATRTGVVPAGFPRDPATRRRRAW
jgi:16S rRNA (guanine527-N7)-methyltransferase